MMAGFSGAEELEGAGQVHVQCSLCCYDFQAGAKSKLATEISTNCIKTCQ